MTVERLELDHSVLVSGAGSGIGAARACGITEQGIKVGVVRRAASKLERHGGECGMFAMIQEARISSIAFKTTRAPVLVLHIF